MVRNRKGDERKISEIDGQTMKEAVRVVIIGGNSIRKAAQNFGIQNSTLRRYVEKFKMTVDKPIFYAPQYSCRKVFTDEEELSLKDYLVKATKIQYGQSSTQVRQLAYELAVRNKKSFPASWEKNKSAGEDWFYSYRNDFPS